MKLEEATSLFTLAGIPVIRTWDLSNRYWPVCADYLQLRADNPWWLMQTHVGLIEIGWRKRVIAVDWSDTPVRVIVTKDNVTVSETNVHAWSMEDALKYLKVLALEIMLYPPADGDFDRASIDKIITDAGWSYLGAGYWKGHGLRGTALQALGHVLNAQRPKPSTPTN